MLVDADDLQIGELSDEEKARREYTPPYLPRTQLILCHRRMRAGDSAGITHYCWSEDAAFILIPVAGKQYLFSLEHKSVRCLRIPDMSMTDTKLSPNANYVTFVCEQNLYAFELATEKLMQLTHDGGGAITNGTAEFVAQEEMDRYTGEAPEPLAMRSPFLAVVKICYRLRLAS